MQEKYEKIRIYRTLQPCRILPEQSSTATNPRASHNHPRNHPRNHRNTNDWWEARCPTTQPNQKPWLVKARGSQESWKKPNLKNKTNSPPQKTTETTRGTKNNQEELAKPPWMSKDYLKPDHRHHVFDYTHCRSTEARRFKEIARIHGSADIGFSHQNHASTPKTLARHRVSSQSLACAPPTQVQMLVLATCAFAWMSWGQQKVKQRWHVPPVTDATFEGREIEYVEDGLCRQNECPPHNLIGLHRVGAPQLAFVKRGASEKRNHWPPQKFFQVCTNIFFEPRRFQKLGSSLCMAMTTHWNPSVGLTLFFNVRKAFKRANRRVSSGAALITPSQADLQMAPNATRNGLQGKCTSSATHHSRVGN